MQPSCLGVVLSQIGHKSFLGYTYSPNLAYSLSERQKPWNLTQVLVILGLHPYPLMLQLQSLLNSLQNHSLPVGSIFSPCPRGWWLAYQFSCNFSQHLLPKQITWKWQAGGDPSQTSSAFSTTGTRWVRKKARHIEKGFDQRKPGKQKIRTSPGFFGPNFMFLTSHLLQQCEASQLPKSVSSNAIVLIF